MDLLQFLYSGATDSLIFFLPAIVYNLSIYIYFLRILERDLIPLDGGRTLGSKPLLGAGRGVEGFYVAIFVGGVWSIFISKNDQPMYLTLGANAGTIVSSFIKRRIGLKRGSASYPLDNMDFIAGAACLYSLAYTMQTNILAFGLILSGVGHLMVNIFLRPVFERSVKSTPGLRDRHPAPPGQ